MTERDPRPVVVAVGHDPIDAAIAFAAAEATRADCGLHLVHVVHEVHQGPETSLMAMADVEAAGRRALNTAVERARDLVPATVSVTFELHFGGVVPTLADIAAGARMIVVERRDLSRAMRLFSRSISSGVAARAHAPVVSVPARWSPGEDRDVATVTVGVDVPERAELVLRAAAAEARSRGATLHVLHTWNFPSAYDDLILTRTEDQEWADRATHEIREALDALGDEVEGIPVRIEARHAHAAAALIGAGRTSDLLVIGRHDPLVPIGSHLGPIARAVLREADCPVLLADPRPVRRWRRHPHDATDTAAHSA